VKAVFSPGPSYHDRNVRQYAGWVFILDLYKWGLEELGYEVIVPYVEPELIDKSSTVSKICSYDLVASRQIPADTDLFLGPPGYSITQMTKLKHQARKFLYVWNNADWWRDQQLAEEYERFGQPYDLSPAWRWINRTALEMCDHVIACSPWVKGTHSKVVPEDKISIAFWGVDSEKFRPLEPLDMEAPGFNVLFVGGDPTRKGLRYLVEAMKYLRGAELWTAGCTPGWGFPKDMKVRQLGMLPHDEIVKVYQQCHVICIPTLEDGIALAIQEGMACGLVPVTSPETAEVFVDGDSGFKVGYRAVESIREKLEWLRYNNLRREMSRKARKLARSQTWEKTKEEFKDIIKREGTR